MRSTKRVASPGKLGERTEDPSMCTRSPAHTPTRLSLPVWKPEEGEHVDGRPGPPAAALDTQEFLPPPSAVPASCVNIPSKPLTSGALSWDFTCCLGGFEHMGDTSQQTLVLIWQETRGPAPGRRAWGDGPLAGPVLPVSCSVKVVLAQPSERCLLAIGPSTGAFY